MMKALVIYSLQKRATLVGLAYLIFSACNPLAGSVRGVGGASASLPAGTTVHATGAAQPNAVISNSADGATATLNPSGMAPTTGTGAVNNTPVDLGPNVLVLDSNIDTFTLQSKISAVYAKQQSNHFGKERFAILFLPGRYTLDVKLGFFTTVAGLGTAVDDVTITGSVRVKGEFLPDNNATQNFWRGAENFSVVPVYDGNAQVWAVSQGTFLRRVHVRGNLNLSDNGWSSGGFVSDTKVDGVMDSGTQQQFLTRNSTLGKWQGKNWNMVFVGVTGAPTSNWPADPYSVVVKTPAIREKPYLAVDGNGAYVVRYPLLKSASQGIGFQDSLQAPAVVPMTSFYVAHADKDTADTLNAALKKGLHILFTPGVYALTQSLQVSYKNTILLGLGLATLVPTQGTQAIVVADVDGVTLSGLLLDAGPINSPSLLQLGGAGAAADHSANPAVLHDIFCRVGGAGAAKTSACLVVHSNNAVLDNVWLWRADHGDGAGWDSNPSANGIVVNGAMVTAYGLFSEHFQEYQTLWNGEGGQTYMYQSEFPYDPPNQAAWRHDAVNGYASYKVAPQVKNHTALGLGMYCVFANQVSVDSAIEAPTGSGVNVNHLITVWLGVADGSSINHLINSDGAAATSANRTVKSSR